MPIAPEPHFERLLESVELEVSDAHRRTLGAGNRFTLPAGTAMLAFVDEGILRGGHGVTCVVDRGSAGGPASSYLVSPGTFPTEHPAGAVLLSLGREALTLEAAQETTVVTVALRFTEAARRLVGLLPDPLTVTEFAELDPAVAALASSMGTGYGAQARSGDTVICRLMAHTLLVAVLRSWFTAGCAPQGWSARAADPQLDQVLLAMHRDPGNDWTVESLAELGAMSRAAFARRFRDQLGESPVQYLTGVRMEAAKRLLGSGLGVSQASRELGYASDEGFSRAFRRHTGVQPSRWQTELPLAS